MCVCVGGLVSWFQFFNLLVLIRNRTRFSIITIYRKMVEKKIEHIDANESHIMTPITNIRHV